MKIYRVGGAVRDHLLHLPVTEVDWVVVGGTAADLIQKGFRPVGRDFPVFLHPETSEEYALARTERKTGPGYGGFACHFDPDVTLEEDLKRRDLTINAMAEADDGTLIDPYGGQRDLKLRRLRHVSSAFIEDPLRVLRVARFAARFWGLGFQLAAETEDLMRAVVASGEMEALVPERIFKEFERALQTNHPAVFLKVLQSVGALESLFPEIHGLFGVPQDPRSHPEIDTGVHSLLVLEAAAGLTRDPMIRFAALVHDLGKGVTDPSEWPRHPHHEALGLPRLEALAQRLRLPKAYQRLAQKVMACHGQVHKAETLGASELLNLLEALDGFRHPEGVVAVLIACKADCLGRPGHEADAYPQGERVRRALEIARGVTAARLIDQGLEGRAVGEALQKARIEALKAAGF